MSKWLLVVFDVPDRHAALLGRLGFRPSKKNPANWWHIYDPKTDHDGAVYAREKLLAAGLKGKWTQVDGWPAFKPQPYHRPGEFGGSLNASPIKGTWRMRKHRT